ncbi:MAG: hypothetical protein K2V38_16520 [Gemmataceae bacterium]|nr:hypothetical protein [Gemmataceae bacterium]
MHLISLGPPWQIVPSAGGTHTTHSRKFGRPRALDPHERVRLVCEVVPGPAVVRLNGAEIGAPGAPGGFEADVTAALQARNEVTFDVGSAAPLGPVRLEIRAGT